MSHLERTDSALPWIPVRGASMWPALRQGDALELVPLAQPPAPGQVVVARFGEGLVAHRVLATDAGRVLLKGDACQATDGWVPLRRLLGGAGRVRRRARLLERAQWDRGPRWLGRLRLRAAASLRQLLGKGP